VSALSLRVDEQEFDLLAGGKWEIVFAKSVATLPVQALLSMQYASPWGGSRFVIDHPINLDFVDVKQGGGCCVLM
jgi:hypothetical protein